MRTRKLYAWWSICQTCGKSQTGLGKSIHGLISACSKCRDYNIKERRSVYLLNLDYDFMEETQLAYGIAWGVE
jgi:hypothetical protein